MYNYNAKVERWVDGDTVLLNIDLGFFTIRQERIRLARINAPEINSPTSYIRRKAIHARNVVKLFCPEGSDVTITTEKNKRDMYARYLGEVIYKGKNVSDFLIKNGCVEEVEY